MATTDKDYKLVNALLDSIEQRILPMTRAGVENGNKIFGAALLTKSDFSTILAETNNEIENPLWHGEIHLLKRFYEIPSDRRPKVSDLIFLSTHEPCSMCLSAITWAGFDNFYYFFSYHASRDQFAIPHDLAILKEVFGLEEGRYRKSNSYWVSRWIPELLDKEPTGWDNVLSKRFEAISLEYERLSSSYQCEKRHNAIPLK